MGFLWVHSFFTIFLNHFYFSSSSLKLEAGRTSPMHRDEFRVEGLGGIFQQEPPAHFGANDDALFHHSLVGFDETNSLSGAVIVIDRYCR